MFSVMCPTSVAQPINFCGNRVNRFLGYFFASVLSRFGAKPFEKESTFVFSVTCPTSALRSTYFCGNQVNHYFKKFCQCVWFRCHAEGGQVGVVHVVSDMDGQTEFVLPVFESEQSISCADCLPHKYEDCITDVGHITENTNSAFPLGWFTNKTAKTWNKTENDLADCNKNVETASQTSVTSQKTLGIPLEWFCAPK